jgi:hypothetical protein
MSIEGYHEAYSLKVIKFFKYPKSSGIYLIALCLEEDE